MDKALFIGMSGADSQMHQLEVLTNNLANVNTPAFRSDSTVSTPFNVNINGQQTRIYSKLDKSYTDFSHGALYSTGRDLDVAITGDGFIAVQNKNGEEGYTRAGNLQISANGVLTTASGLPVKGNGGIIAIPQAERVQIAQDGTVLAKLQGTTNLVPVDRIKLTNPQIAGLEKGEDGLFYLPNNTAAQPDLNVRVASQQLEGSNVNAIDTLTKLIDISRQYEFHANMMKSIADNSGVVNQLLEV